MMSGIGGVPFRCPICKKEFRAGQAVEYAKHMEDHN